jgi:hypothetical protein
VSLINIRGEVVWCGDLATEVLYVGISGEESKQYQFSKWKTVADFARDLRHGECNPQRLSPIGGGAIVILSDVEFGCDGQAGNPCDLSITLCSQWSSDTEIHINWRRPIYCVRIDEED